MNMGMLSIDENTCKKDGICVRECFARAITLTASGGFPEITPENENRCISCGHCAAVCPHDTLSLEDIPMEACPLIDEGLSIKELQAKQFLRSRLSARLCLDKPVERKKIEKLIDVARYAPTGRNNQAVEWLILTDKENHPHHYPLLVGYHKSHYRRLPERKPPRCTFR
jgi:Fe-S-cluster-containing hydrogenase component 2